MHIYTSDASIIIRRACKVKGAEPKGPFIVLHRKMCYTGHAALLQSGNRTEVRHLNQALTDFIVAVAAQVTAYYLCKWLSGHHKGK